MMIIYNELWLIFELLSIMILILFLNNVDVILEYTRMEEFVVFHYNNSWRFVFYNFLTFSLFCVDLKMFSLFDMVIFNTRNVKIRNN